MKRIKPDLDQAKGLFARRLLAALRADARGATSMPAASRRAARKLLSLVMGIPAARKALATIARSPARHRGRRPKRTV